MQVLAGVSCVVVDQVMAMLLMAASTFMGGDKCQLLRKLILSQNHFLDHFKMIFVVKM